MEMLASGDAGFAREAVDLGYDWFGDDLGDWPVAVVTQWASAAANGVADGDVWQLLLVAAGTYQYEQSATKLRHKCDIVTTRFRPTCAD